MELNPHHIYTWYLQNVLGVKGVILEPALPPSEPQVSTESTPHLKVLFIIERQWSLNEQALFRKIQSAMELPDEFIQVLILEGRDKKDLKLDLQLKLHMAEQVIVFSKEAFEQMIAESQNFSLQKIQLTHSPAEMLKNPELKKKVWADLKAVLKKIR
jgi:hypothetical protein